MSITVPDEGELAMLVKLLASDLILRLFKNNITPGNATTAADFSEASFTGYAAATLHGGASWVTASGDPSVATYAAQTFTCSGAGVAQTIYGYYVVDSGNKVWLAERFPSAQQKAISAVGQFVTVNPRLTLSDEGD